MPFVIDASVAASWCFEDEDAAPAEAAMDQLREDEAIAPALWWVEIRNILIVNEWRGRIESEDANAFLDDLGRLPIRIEWEPSAGEREGPAPRKRQPGSSRVMALARRHRLTAYDASYLDLALRTDGPLATLDRTLARAATAEGVPLLA